MSILNAGGWEIDTESKRRSLEDDIAARGYYFHTARPDNGCSSTAKVRAPRVKTQIIPLSATLLIDYCTADNLL